MIMEKLRIQDQKITLVDQVEMRLMEYFNEHDLRPGSALPNEMELSESLGVARTVLREALSRLKMVGMIESRTRRGMVLSSPSLMGSIKRVVNPLWMTEETLLDMLEFRIVLEIGCVGSIFRNVTAEDIRELENTRFVMFLRPRRFGKSLLVSMLQCYYDVHYAARFDDG